MDPRHLMQLAVVVELGSVTKAARKLNLTQPTLSRTIRVIEDRVGGKVLRRGRYGVTATQIGQRLAEEGRAIILHAEAAQLAVQEWRHGLGGDVRLGLGPMLAVSLMAEFFSRNAGSAPAYGLKLSTDLPMALLDRLKADELDAAILPHDLSRRDDTLHRDLLFTDRLAIFVGSRDPLAGQSGVDPARLADHAWITVSERAGLFDLTHGALEALGLPDVIPRIENSGDVMITFRLLEQTRACAVLPLRLASLVQDRFRIAPVTVTASLPTRDVGFWTTPTGRDRPEVVDFRARLRAFLPVVGLAG